MPIINTVIKGGGGSAPAHYIGFGVAGSGKLLEPTTLIDLTGVTDIANRVLKRKYQYNTNVSGTFVADDIVSLTGSEALYGFSETDSNGQRNGITSVSFASLETIAGVDCLTTAFFHSSVTTMNIPNLKAITGYNAMVSCFALSLLTSVNLPNLEKITSYQGMSDTYWATPITSINLPKLVCATGDNCMQLFAEICTSLVNVVFPSLRYVTGSEVLSNAFMDSTNVADIKFPAITTTSFGSNTNQLNNMCGGVANVTIRFPSNVQSVVESLQGYSTTAPFGATAGTVLFDLPATVILTGANSQTYERSPKDDTGTALAWRKQDTGTAPDLVIDWTPFYTSGTTDPAVNDTIYSDSACTTAVTTIDSIA